VFVLAVLGGLLMLGLATFLPLLWAKVLAGLTSVGALGLIAFRAQRARHLDRVADAADTLDTTADVVEVVVDAAAEVASLVD
jgi:hypothetical protein